jgi:biopolymer transport protein TolR
MAASPFHKSEEPAPIAEVNVVPLADVSLVLLIILLVLSPMAAQSMLKIQAAAAKSATPDKHLPAEIVTLREAEKTLVVSVTAGGLVADGRLIGSSREFREWLKPVLAGREDRKVFLVPDLEVEHGLVVAALESAAAAGGSPALVQVADAEAP